MNARFRSLNNSSKTIDRIFTETKHFIHNFWRDAYFNFVDFYGKILPVFLVDSDRFIFWNKFFEARLIVSMHNSQCSFPYSVNIFV